MTTNDSPITEQLPDLPALESAEAGPTNVLLAISITMGLALCATGGYLYFYLTYRQFFIELLPTATVGLGVMVLGCVWLAAHLLLGDLHWHTDAGGITIRSLLRRRFLPWQDVEEVSSRRTILGTECFVLWTSSSNRIWVPAHSSYGALNVCASIWQHLRRLGKADNLSLPELVLTFWDRIPDELPREMDWVNTRVSPTWPTVMLLLVFAGFVIWGAFDAASQGQYIGTVFMSLVAVGILWGCRAIIREAVPYAREAHLTDGRIDARTRHGAVSVSWSDVKCAKWRMDANTKTVYILIGGGQPYREVAVPYVPFSEESYKLILAVIRRVRTAGTPQVLTIPSVLRSISSPDVQPSALPAGEPVTLRFMVAEKLAIALLPTMTGFFLAVWLVDQRHAGLLAALPPALLLLIGWRVTGTYAIEADSSGIRKRFMFWTKTVAWRDVAGYEVHGSRHAVSMLKRLLKGRDGKALIDITPDAGRKSDQQRFQAYVHARLAEVLPPEALNPPWKARPWTPSVPGG